MNDPALVLYALWISGVISSGLLLVVLSPYLMNDHWGFRLVLGMASNTFLTIPVGFMVFVLLRWVSGG